jgi:cation diffusion facilitator family transporter
VIAGLIGTAFGFLFLDQVVAFVVVVFIVKAAWNIMFSSVNTLIDAAPMEDYEIRKVAEKVKGVKNIHAIKCRGDKSCTFVELHIQVKDEMTIKQGHDLSEEVKNKIMGSIDGVVDVLVHIEPESDPVESD